MQLSLTKERMSKHSYPTHTRTSIQTQTEAKYILDK